MFVAKQFDIIMGVDTHIILVPTPGGPVPTPIPHPFIGIVFDPPEFVPIIGASILVNGIPRGQAGTKVKNTVPHIPIGGPFQKPPSNAGEVQMGSLTILADWQPCSFSGLPVYTCQDIGKTAPKRKKRKGGGTKGLVLPTSILLAIPKGGVNGVGGAGGVPIESKEDTENKMLNAGKLPDKGELTAAGRAAQKHGSRPGSVFPKLKGNPQSMNEQGQNILEGIVKHPNAIMSSRVHPKFGRITEVRLPSGQGARFKSDFSKLIGFLEP